MKYYFIVLLASLSFTSKANSFCYNKGARDVAIHLSKVNTGRQASIAYRYYLSTLWSYQVGIGYGWGQAGYVSFQKGFGRAIVGLHVGSVIKNRLYLNLLGGIVVGRDQHHKKRYHIKERQWLIGPTGGAEIEWFMAHQLVVLARILPTLYRTPKQGNLFDLEMGIGIKWIF